MAFCAATDTLLSASLDCICQWSGKGGAFVKNFRSLGGKFSVIDISHSGDIAVSGSHDGMLRCWNVSSGDEVSRIKGHDGEVHSVSLTLDGRYAVSGADDDLILVWHMDSARKVAIFALDKDMSKGLARVSVALKPPNPGDALRLAVGCTSGLLCPFHLHLPEVLGDTAPILSVPQLSLDEPGGTQEMVQSRENIMSVALDIESSFFFASDEAIGGMTGDLTCDLAIPERILRVYVSSVSPSQEHERAALLSMVYPLVRQYALARGVGFHMSCDFGPHAVLDEEDRLSARLHELGICQRESKGVSLIALIDNRESAKHFAVQLSSQAFGSLCEIFKPAPKKDGSCCTVS